MNVFHLCDSTDIFIRRKMKCSIQVQSIEQSIVQIKKTYVLNIAYMTIDYLQNVNLGRWPVLPICLNGFAN